MTDFRALCEELVDLVDNCWAEAAMKKQLSGLGYAREIAKKTLEWAAPILRQQGADQELEACIDLLKADGYNGKAIDLRTARRPKPPSLKEQALEAAKRFYAQGHEDCTDEEVTDDYSTIRRALEQLDG